MIFLVVLIVAAACWPTSLALHQRWTAWEETTYTHGWLIAAVTLFLLWRNRGAARDVNARLEPWPLAALLGLGLLWAFGVRAGMAFIEWLLFPLLLWVAIRAGFGALPARHNLFAVANLYFAMPLWGAVNGLFLWMTVMVVRGLLRLTDVPAYFDGNLVQVPAGVFEIAGGCSGLHFVMVALALGALMGELRGDDWRGRLKLVVLAGALAVVTNWIRVFTIILFGHLSDMQHYLVTKSHYGYGWALFAVAMVVFFLLERRMTLHTGQVSAGPAAISTPAMRSNRVLPVMAVALVMAVVAIMQVMSARPAAVAASGSALPATAAQPQVPDGQQWHPVVEAADLSSVQVGTDADARLEQRRYIFLSQKQGKEIGGYAEDPLGGMTLLDSREGRLAQVPVTLLEGRTAGAETWLVAASYRIDTHRYAKALPAKVRYAGQSLLQLRSAPAELTLWRAPCVPDCPAAQQALEAFIAATEMED
jgi:exosortase